MAKDKPEVKAASRHNGNQQEDVDKQYYTNLYNDLPREVVDILMQTHPLMGQTDDPGATAYRTRRQQQQEVDAIRQERMNQVGKEVQVEIGRTTKEPVSRYQDYDEGGMMDRNYRDYDDTNPMGRGYEEEPRMDSSYQNYQDESRMDRGSYRDYDDAPKKTIISMGSIRSKEMSEGLQYAQEHYGNDSYEEQPQEYHPRAKEMDKPKKKSKKHPKEELDFGRDSVGKKNYVYEDIDFEQKAKDEELDRLYDDYEEEEPISIGAHKKTIAFTIIAILIIGFLGFKTISLGGQLSKAKVEIENLKDISAKYEDLQLEKISLESELKTLKGGDTSVVTSPEDGNTTTNTTENENTGEYDTYTAKANDTYWNIAQQYYGNGSEYTKILEANGKTEADVNKIKEGMKLKIPKKN